MKDFSILLSFEIPEVIAVNILKKFTVYKGICGPMDFITPLDQDKYAFVV